MQIHLTRSGRSIVATETVCSCNGSVGLCLIKQTSVAQPKDLFFDVKEGREEIFPTSASDDPEGNLVWFKDKGGGRHGGFTFLRTEYGFNPSISPVKIARITVNAITLPYWFILAVSSIAPMLGMFGAVRRKLRRQNSSTALGFSLTAMERTPGPDAELRSTPTPPSA